jgi:hypothetical protein
MNSFELSSEISSAGKVRDLITYEENGVPTGKYRKQFFSHISTCHFKYLYHICPRLSLTVQIKRSHSLDTFIHECVQEKCGKLNRVPNYSKGNLRASLCGLSAGLSTIVTHNRTMQ